MYIPCLFLIIIKANVVVANKVVYYSNNTYVKFKR